MIKVGDLVKIKSRKDNVIFRVNYIDNNSVQLKGEVIRLLCTSQLDDLVPCTIDEVKMSHYQLFWKEIQKRQ